MTVHTRGIFDSSLLSFQAASLEKLEAENAEAAKKLEDVVSEGGAILQEIQAALHDIAQAQLEIQKVEASRDF